MQSPVCLNKGTCDIDYTDPVEQICCFLPFDLRQAVLGMSKKYKDKLIELRLRKHMHVICNFVENDLYLCRDGRLLKINAFTNLNQLSDILVMDDNEWTKTIQLVTSNSLYALEKELKSGFITIKGGHRVGIVGKSVYQEGKLTTQSQISSLNFRICRYIGGISKMLMPYIIVKEKDMLCSENVLIISPPGLGKTTILRDIARMLSCGCSKLAFKGCRVSIIDERSEIAACYDGVPQFDLGPRTDVLDGCDKKDGIIIAIRSMSPDVVIVDEIGTQDDADAIYEARKSGVKVIATAHAKDIKQACTRMILKELIAAEVFDLVITLGHSKGIGTVESVYCIKSNSELTKDSFVLQP